MGVELHGRIHVWGPGFKSQGKEAGRALDLIMTDLCWVLNILLDILKDAKVQEQFFSHCFLKVLRVQIPLHLPYLGQVFCVFLFHWPSEFFWTSQYYHWVRVNSRDEMISTSMYKESKERGKSGKQHWLRWGLFPREGWVWLETTTELGLVERGAYNYRQRETP